jgi:signal transduction histidine kinase
MIERAGVGFRGRFTGIDLPRSRAIGDGVAIAAAAIGGFLIAAALEAELSRAEVRSLLVAHVVFWLAGLVALRCLSHRRPASFSEALYSSAFGLIAGAAVVLSIPAVHTLGVAVPLASVSSAVAAPALGVSAALAVPALILSRRVWSVDESSRATNGNDSRRQEEALSIVFHELRRPLSVLVSASELALDADTSEDERRDLLQRVNHQALRLSDFLEEILEAARIQSGRLRLNLRPVDLRKVVREGGAEFAEAHRSYELRVKVGRQVQTVAADPTKLGMVLSNLLANAVAYSPQGSTITMRLLRTDRTVRIHVEDQGPGVPEPYREQIFEQFFRIPGTPQRGFGLGLYIARQLVEAHGGTIGVERKHPRGSRFIIELPALKKASLPTRREGSSPTYRPRRLGAPERRARPSISEKREPPTEIAKR